MGCKFELAGEVFMNICVFGAAEDMPYEVMQAGEHLGDWIAQNGYGLVYGGFGDGLLGAVARHAAAGSPRITGVFPAEKRKNHSEFDKCTQVLRSADKRERKRMQAENADAFIVLPYGIGVMDELFEVLTLKSYGEIKGRVVIFNVGNYYDTLQKLLQEQHGAHLCEFVRTIDELRAAFAK